MLASKMDIYNGFWQFASLNCVLFKDALILYFMVYLVHWYLHLSIWYVLSDVAKNDNKL